MRTDHKSNATPQFSIQLVPASDLTEFQDDVLLFIKTVLYSSNFITIIEFMESKIDNFFIQYEGLKLFLFKLQYFHYILLNTNADNLNKFFIENIKPIIEKKSNYEEINQCLMCIRDNPLVIDSRYYPQMREEWFRIFELSIQDAIQHIFAPKKKMRMSGKDYEYYMNNKGRLDIIEFDLVTQSKIMKIQKSSSDHSHGNRNDESNVVMSNDNVNKNQNSIEFGVNGVNGNTNYNYNNIIMPFDAFDLQEGNTDTMNIDADEDNNTNNIFSISNSYSSSAQTSINNNNNSNSYSLNALYDDNYQPHYNNRNTGPLIVNYHNSKINTYSNNLNLNSNSNSNRNSKTQARLTQPSIQKEKKTKLKRYQFRFTKRENIDKKILRKFRKFLSQRIKKNDDYIRKIVLNNDFWISFINKNLLPPFIYPPKNKTFKSFNTRFMLWIFEHDNSAELYSYYIKTYYQHLVDNFANKFNLKEGNEEFALLKKYINSFAKVFGNTTPSFSSAATKLTYDCVFEGEPNKGEAKVNVHSNNGNEVYIGNTEDNCNGINSIQQKTNDFFEEIISNDYKYIQGNKSIGGYSFDNEDIMMNYFNSGLNLNEYDNNDNGNANLNDGL